MDTDEARVRLLDAAEELFYERGIQAVGIDELRSTSGVSLKRLYQCFPAKQQLVEEYLRRRDDRWRARLAAYVTEQGVPPEDRVLAVFDWLRTWFDEPNFRGCAFVNSYGELGATEPGIAEVVRAHHAAVRDYLAGLVADLQVREPGELGEQLWLLVVGSATGAAITENAAMAGRARATAQLLLTAARR